MVKRYKADAMLEGGRPKAGLFVAPWCQWIGTVNPNENDGS